MIGNANYSKWGIKDSGEDITNDIIDIVHSANTFIIIGGYNFSFRGMGLAFFTEIVNKAQNGVPVLMIFPPFLFGGHNPQPRLINFCLAHNIGVILNHHNHSKWLMTENDLYYGSSNFTPTSWRDRVEVVTIHRHRNIASSWKRPTILDFRYFIQREIADLTNPRRRMHTYTGLVTLTVTTWNNIRPLVKRLNPSVEKVKQTIENFDEVELSLKFIVEEWFDFGNEEMLEEVYDMNGKILESVENLCEYGYANIYNETMLEDTIVKSEMREVNNRRTINKYNELHAQFESTLNTQISRLEKFTEVKKDSQILAKNQSLLTKIGEQMNKNNKG